MASKLQFNFQLKDWFSDLAEQFRNLDPKDPSNWPVLPRALVFVSVTVLCLVVLWFLWLSDNQTTLTTEQEKELTLRDEYKLKLGKAINLDALKKQREQVQLYVTQLEKQLPSKAEMDALLSDVNQAGLGRSLQFDLFRPGQVVVKDYYAELPIAVRVTGKYHDIGNFAADVANLSRIVTLNNMTIVPAKDGMLAMDATAKTFRYLDSEEISAQRMAAKGAKK
ncbi:type 4a pilus biogenesis protein PilO [Rhodoferax sp.]|uniref:type 4a pilus biogenesis protein PilO n=1 Tax=Rhodoferax sp. TaxID=50421 RepID=UPI00260FCD22|nr:type 4a pilus biogenesis protein PilO [Rhodoferax sp.]MDD4943187.1 type 4a pilus biogenesis protein PilO [Rhodoferax sp.]MDD5479936.1 type 4a pilus biogenesis protein PilO [Rhodoferax sp.]